MKVKVGQWGWVRLLWLFIECQALLEADRNGYILYCPCMGRFGNQADQFLGSLAFSRSLNRTLVLPPWVEYHRMSASSVQISFDTYFKVQSLREYHKVMTMEVFMKELAPQIWPPGKRSIFCFQSREGTKTGDCNAKDGNPFGPFWDHFNVDFDKSEFYAPLYFETTNSHEMKRWEDKYPPSQYPVLAFTGPPASFPVKRVDVRLQKYLKWSDYINGQAEAFIRKNVQEKPFLGIHLRIGSDWTSTCEHVNNSPMLFAAAQCIGYRGEYGKITKEMCLPSEKTIINQVKRTVKQMKAKTVFVATDDRDLIAEMSKVMAKVKFVRFLPPEPHVDLAILAKADHYIGNCISTFSAFAKRERDVYGKKSSFWAFKKDAPHEEL